MLLKTIWTDRRDEARMNEYNALCADCGKPVLPKGGRLVSQANSDGSAEIGKNKALHEYCQLPTGWHYRALMGLGQSLSSLGYEWDASAQWWVMRTHGSVPYNASPELAEPEQPEPEREPTEAELSAAVDEILKRTTDNFLREVPILVRQSLAEMTRSVEIKLGKAPAVKVEHSHIALTDVVQCVAAGTIPFLVGPAGSGKTTLGQQVCSVMKRKFYCENRVTSEYKLVGFMDATGKYVRTQFREAFEHGGGFLLDECDASDPDVLTALNTALSNDFFPFPDKMVKKHKDFFAIAAGNTWGRGADREYVGRQQLDGATIDRFVFVEVDYDEVAELAWAGDDDWTLYVQQVRKAVYAAKVRLIVSPRASINGARLLSVGMERDKVAERCIWKGLDEPQRARILAEMGSN